jgi:hypothetical protein
LTSHPQPTSVAPGQDNDISMLRGRTCLRYISVQINIVS